MSSRCLTWQAVWMCAGRPILLLLLAATATATATATTAAAAAEAAAPAVRPSTSHSTSNVALRGSQQRPQAGEQGTRWPIKPSSFPSPLLGQLASRSGPLHLRETRGMGKLTSLAPNGSLLIVENWTGFSRSLCPPGGRVLRVGTAPSGGIPVYTVRFS